MMSKIVDFFIIAFVISPAIAKWLMDFVDGFIAAINDAKRNNKKS